MAEPLTDQTGPLDAGHTTTEYESQKFIVVLTSILSALSLVVSFAEKILPFLPPETSKVGMWAAIGFAVIGGLRSIVYEMQRTALKVAALKAGVRVAAGTDPAAVAPAAASAAASLSQ